MIDDSKRRNPLSLIFTTGDKKSQANVCLTLIFKVTHERYNCVIIFIRYFDTENILMRDFLEKFGR